MKKLYKLVIFLVVFQFSVIIMNATGVFPNTLYSDVETEDLRAVENPLDMLPELFDINVPGLTPVLEIAGIEESFTFPVLVFIFIVFGAVIAKATHSVMPIVIAIIGASFVPMIMNSMRFFNKLFYNWDSVTLGYMAICLGVGVVLLAVITILETATHGDV